LILVDTNILFDLATDDSEWFAWSRDAMQAAASDGLISINPIIYAELSVRYESLSEVDDFLELVGVQILDLSNRAAFLAAKAYTRYRLSGGTKTGVLSDFFIGAHAAVLDSPLLTRDTRRYRTYFPDVQLISPQVN
jgi:predicted nucleic acid-binding protein